MKRNYETLIIIRPDDDEQISKTIESVKKFISKEVGGEIQEENQWGKRKLTFEIEKLKDGFYTLINFELDPEKIADLKNFYKHNENIIHSIVVKKDKN